MLVVAASLCFGIGLAHSYLGERYILIRLFRGSRSPQLFGSDFFTKRTLRFAWHITTLSWWGMGYLLLAISRDVPDLAREVLVTVGVVFLLSGVIAFVFSKGKHLSWIVFGLIAGLVLYVGMSR
jgi:hypothetical protein